MTKQCAQCHKTYNISEQDHEYYNRIGVPDNSLCFKCTKIRQLNWRNERMFYSRTCDQCKKNMISCFPKEAKHPVFCNECWWSDKFDAREYGQDYDFSKPFFQQFAELLNKTPVGNLFIADSENSEYTNLAVGNKNCYMINSSDYNENLMYSSYSSYDKDSGDCTEVKNSELCYDSINLERCYLCNWSQNLKGCNHCQFCFDLSGCQDCLGCVNLRNANYYIFNKKYSPDEYKKKLEKYALHTYNGYQKFAEEFRIFKEKQFYLFSRHLNCEKSTGDYLINCKNCLNCFNMLDCEDCVNCIHGDKAKDSYDSMGVVNSELVYNSIACPSNNRTRFSAIVWPGSVNIDYSFLIRTAQNCFGCVSLHNNQFCILNKQYTEESFDKLRIKIIEHMQKTGEWGQFLPMNISPFAYNESVGQDLFPLTKEQVQALGGRWQNILPFTKNKETVFLDKIPETAEEIGNLEKEILACGSCQRNYKIVPQEMFFYRRLRLPFPRLCPECRHKNRMSLRNYMNLWQRQCMCTQPDHNHQGRCKNEFETTYSPERKELVYCEECYNKEIY